jgi:hypothetical protein
MDLISNEALTQTLRELICRHGGTSQYAKYLGVSCAFVSRMASGQRYISGRVLEDLGYQRVVMFRKVGHNGAEAHPTESPGASLL